MPTFSLRSLPRRHLAWLLWFALLLPLAQAAAACHVYSHIGAQGDVDGKPALHATQCDLCLTGASIGAGALPATPQVLLPSTARFEVPQALAIDPFPARTTPAYRSRAPPLAAC